MTNKIKIIEVERYAVICGVKTYETLFHIDRVLEDGSLENTKGYVITIGALALLGIVGAQPGDIYETSLTRVPS